MRYSYGSKTPYKARGEIIVFLAIKSGFGTFGSMAGQGFGLAGLKSYIMVFRIILSDQGSLAKKDA